MCVLREAAGKDGRLAKPQAFILMLQPFGRWEKLDDRKSWQGTEENLKIEHVNSISGGSSATGRRWQVIGHYERCWGFFRDSQKVKVVSGKTLWAKWCMKACDFKKLQASTDKNNIARLFRNNFVTMASIGWTHPSFLDGRSLGI